MSKERARILLVRDSRGVVNGCAIQYEVSGISTAEACRIRQAIVNRRYKAIGRKIVFFCDNNQEFVLRGAKKDIRILTKEVLPNNRLKMRAAYSGTETIFQLQG